MISAMSPTSPMTERVAADHAGAMLRIALVRAWPDHAEVLELRMADSSVVADAIAKARAAGWQISDGEQGRIAVFGRLVTPDRRLSDGDRIELLRTLEADPKQRRRARASPPPRNR